MTPRLGGYALDRIRDINWREEAFQQLVLGDKQKQLIHSLVKQHSAKASFFDDIIAGKGQGLVGLLSGSPGCGKTLTAEAVAEITHRPLYIVSAGELGTEPHHLDKKLTEIFELAQMWDAVLLLDEADVFLQARSTTDVSRNALVSIFLRQVEYYRGVLIFTTNLMHQIDRAFESTCRCLIHLSCSIMKFIAGRIHFCVRYPDLDFNSRVAIWKTFFNKARTNAGDVSEEDIKRLALHELNGRQVSLLAEVVWATLNIPDSDQERCGHSTVDRVGAEVCSYDRACCHRPGGDERLEHSADGTLYELARSLSRATVRLESKHVTRHLHSNHWPKQTVPPPSRLSDYSSGQCTDKEIERIIVIGLRG